VFLLDDGTIRGWRKLFEHRGSKAHQLRCGRQRELSERRARRQFEGVVGAALSRQTGVFFKQEFCRVHENSGSIPLLHRLVLEYRKPETTRRSDAEGVRRERRKSLEFHGQQGSLAIRRRGASNPRPCGSLGRRRLQPMIRACPCSPRSWPLHGKASHDRGMKRAPSPVPVPPAYRLRRRCWPRPICLARFERALA
jgi:transposase